MTEIDAHNVQFFRVFVSKIHRGAVPPVVFQGFNRNEVVDFRFKTRRRSFHIRIVVRILFLHKLPQLVGDGTFENLREKFTFP